MERVRITPRSYPTNLIDKDWANRKHFHLEKMKGFIKSHLPLALLPAKLWERKNKVIYVFRNPLDAWVSRYYHGVTYGAFYGKTLHQYFDDLLSNENYALETIEHAAEFYQSIVKHH